MGDIVFKNKLRVFFVLISYILILSFFGVILDLFLQSDFAIAMIAIAFMVIFYVIGNSSSIMLRGEVFTPLDRDSELYEILENLTKKSDLGFTPRIYIMEAPFMNAFSSGWKNENSIICLTSALLSGLGKEEIEAILAREIIHIKNGDTRVMISVGILSAIATLFLNLPLCLIGTKFRILNSWEPKSIGFLLRKFLDPSQEYITDSGAMYLLNDSKGLISALQKIKNSYANNEFHELNPTRKVSYIEISNIDDRIDILNRGGNI